jgi:flagellar basal-body rod protein FlgF
VINTPEGQAYTRNGRFTLDANGELVTSNGQPVLDANNRPIVIPEDATDVQIAEDGTISAGNGPLGRFQIVSFANDQDLQTMGDALYTTTQSPVPATGASLVQGAVEESNVQPILEITRMLSAQRSYVDAQNLIQSEGDLQTQTIDKLTQST